MSTEHCERSRCPKESAAAQGETRVQAGPIRQMKDAAVRVRILFQGGLADDLDTDALYRVIHSSTHFLFLLGNEWAQLIYPVLFYE
ncbi:hypothetical protein GWI33_003918 [Rhynchophorus ferrugineus]|uniref:Uncharacterized protein n=1 Tax=Rhynchophorus ferrugineus TaxID=354439 RepID=A0A834IUV8_RHYFE|nr:hypothetical protein GWI33_003918 [Rhynchophorus ferrugineus]